MSFCTVSERYGAYAVTPVENLFIDEFMLRAPGDYVKVYLYGLRMCLHPQPGVTAASVARALGQEEQAVADAFAYWERLGALRRVSSRPLAVEYDNLIDALLARKGGAGEMNHYQDFNQSVQELFAERILHPQDWHVIYDWVEVMGLKQEVVLLMVSHCVKQRGAKVSINYVDKVARSWSEKGITTLPAAQEYLSEIAPGVKGAQAVLKHIGLRRSPSADEVALYTAWVDGMGFTHDAVIAACGEMTRTQKPNFNYLGKVLDNLHREGAHSAEAVREALASRGDQSQLARDIFRALGDGGAIPDEPALARIAKWRAAGFDAHALRHAANTTRLAGGRTLNDLSRTLEKWTELKLFSADALQAFAAEMAQRDAPLLRVMEICGIEREVTPQDRKLYQRWAGVPQGMLEIAAGASIASRNPLAYMDKLIAAWNAKDIATEAAARAYVSLNIPSAKAPGKLPGKEVAEHRYTQREYKEGELDHLLADIMAMDADTHIRKPPAAGTKAREA